MESPNSEEMQRLHLLLVEQILLRPEVIIANLNALLQSRDINFELKLLHADPCKAHREHPDPYHNFPVRTGERMVPGSW